MPMTMVRANQATGLPGPPGWVRIHQGGSTPPEPGTTTVKRRSAGQGSPVIRRRAPGRPTGSNPSARQGMTCGLQRSNDRRRCRGHPGSPRSSRFQLFSRRSSAACAPGVIALGCLLPGQRARDGISHQITRTCSASRFAKQEARRKPLKLRFVPYGGSLRMSRVFPAGVNRDVTPETTAVRPDSIRKGHA